MEGTCAAREDSCLSVAIELDVDEDEEEDTLVAFMEYMLVEDPVVKCPVEDLPPAVMAETPEVERIEPAE